MYAYPLYVPTGGLEKILRLLQSVAQILAFQSLHSHNALFWMHLRKQFALGEFFASLALSSSPFAATFLFYFILFYFYSLGAELLMTGTDRTSLFPLFQILGLFCESSRLFSHGDGVGRSHLWCWEVEFFRGVYGFRISDHRKSPELTLILKREGYDSNSTTVRCDGCLAIAMGRCLHA